MDIINFLQVSERLATSAQPNAEQFAEIAKLGYETIINLALPTSDGAIADEGEFVTSAGMNHVHIPVIWEQQEISQMQYLNVSAAEAKLLTSFKPVMIDASYAANRCIHLP